MTETICDGVLSALADLDENLVADAARAAFRHVKASPDLHKLMSRGFDLKGVNDQSWKEIPAEPGAPNGVRKMGLLAWNYLGHGETLQRSALNKAGIVFVIRDIGRQDVPGLNDVMRSGLIESSDNPAPADAPPADAASADAAPAGAAPTDAAPADAAPADAAPAGAAPADAAPADPAADNSAAENPPVDNSGIDLKPEEPRALEN